MGHSVADRVLVDNGHVLQDEGGERLEVDFFECDLSLDLLGNVIHDFGCNRSLHLWELNREGYSEHKCQDGNKCQPEYFECLFNNFSFLVVQLANLVKISDKIRIFVAGL